MQPFHVRGDRVERAVGEPPARIDGAACVAILHAPAADHIEVLEREGYWESEFKDFDAFWNALIQRGAWWDPSTLPISRNSLLNTSSGKFEFYSTMLKQIIEAAATPTQTESHT